jgi:hypothetical protein
MKSKDKKPAKKPYRKPELRIYGRVRELTEAKFGSGMSDNYGPFLKTG